MRYHVAVKLSSGTNRMNTLKADTEWHLKFFTGASLNVWRNAIPMEVTAEEVEFLHSALQLTEGARLLDVPCGYGRISLPLALAGFKITGFDTSLEFLEEAKKTAREYKAQIEYVERGARHPQH
jgi:2-polyprenyl-3-methyl-5-hydroxy-6-metoxy-1,4-benzoquinol methylase